MRYFFFTTRRSRRLFLLLPGLLLGASACIPVFDGPAPLDRLPAATQTGENTAGCLVDGQPWTAHVNYSLGVSRGPGALALYDTRYLTLSFSKAIDDPSHPNDNSIIEVYVPRCRRVGTYVFDQSSGSLNYYGAASTPAYATFTLRADPHRPGPEQVFVTGPGATGRLVITRLDTVAHVVSGTFDFQAARSASGPSVHLSEGRFDSTF